MQHWKKINWKKEKVWETWYYPKLNVKYHGHHGMKKLRTAKNTKVKNQVPSDIYLHNTKYRIL